MNHHTMCPHCGQAIGANPTPPACDECHGNGYVSVFTHGPQYGGVCYRACSKGCPPVYTVNNSQTFFNDATPHFYADATNTFP